MAFLAISRAARGSLNSRLRRVLRVMARDVDLRTEAQTLAGEEPPAWLDPDGNEWNVYCDSRFRVEDAAVAARALNRTAKLPDPDGEDGPKQRDVLRAESVKAVGGGEVPAIPEGADPYSVTLTHNLAPASIRMFTSVPEGWRPKTDG